MRRILFLLSIGLACSLSCVNKATYKVLDNGYNNEGDIKAQDTLMYIVAIKQQNSPGKLVSDKDTALLSFLVNMEEVFSVKVAEDSYISLDADSYFIDANSLYSYKYLNSSMYICRNAIPIFSYNEREFIRGFYVQGNNVYTLGISPSRALCLRKNGKVVFKEELSEPLHNMNDRFNRGGALYLDNGNLCFYYRKFQSRKNKLSYKSYIYKNGEVIDLQDYLPEHKVVDAIYNKGSLYCLAIKKDKLILYEEDKLHHINDISVEDFSYISLLATQSLIVVRAESYIDNKKILYVWDNKHFSRFYNIPMQRYDYYNTRGEIVFLEKRPNKRVLVEYPEKRKYVTESGLYLTNNKAFKFYNNRFRIALATRNATKSYIWLNNDLLGTAIESKVLMLDFYP